jgi:hypothetical protein
MNNNGFGIINVYPVPVVDQLNVLFNSSVKGDVVLSIQDQLGRVVKLENMNVFNGENKLAVDLKDLAAGVYFVNINNGSEQFNARFNKN